MFNFWQRRYLGNKKSLNEFIDSSLKKNNIKFDTFCDLFAGTGSVGFNQLKNGKDVSLNDLLYSNFVIFQGFSGIGRYDYEKISKISLKYSEIENCDENYVSINFGNKYFSILDSKKIGYIREDIERLKNKKMINIREYFILLSSLLFSFDRIANTVGHYDAYRKISDINDKFTFELIKPFENGLKTNNNNKDSNIFAREVNADVVYIDPPYNSRQYGDAYHLMENIARWEKPKVYGVAMKMDRNHLKSNYSLKSAPIAFETLIASLNCKYIIVSYNDTGMNQKNSRSAAKMSDKDILRALKSRGKVVVEEMEYTAFNTGKTERKSVKERLFICKVNKDPIYKQNLKSPLNYTGGKFKIIKLIKQNLPKNIEKFYDIFSGALNVAVNSESNKVVAIEKNKKLVNLINYIKNETIDKILQRIERNIKKYSLSNTFKNGYSFYEATSSKGLSSHNKVGYNNMRRDLNAITEKNDKYLPLLLTSIFYSFNNLFRFNMKGEYNVPVGKRDYNNSIRSKLIMFSSRLKDIVIEMRCQDFSKIKISEFGKNDFVFLDPPYLITNAEYNSSWSKEYEKKLYAFLEKLNSKGIKFMLTNAISKGENKNLLLNNFISKNNFKIIKTKNNFKNTSYNSKHEVNEIIVMNYKLN